MDEREAAIVGGWEKGSFCEGVTDFIALWTYKYTDILVVAWNRQGDFDETDLSGTGLLLQQRSSHVIWTAAPLEAVTALWRPLPWSFGTNSRLWVWCRWSRSRGGGASTAGWKQMRICYMLEAVRRGRKWLVALESFCASEKHSAIASTVSSKRPDGDMGALSSALLSA